MSSFTTTIEWNTETGEERDVTVSYTYHRAYRGARDSCGGVRGAGPPLEPDEPENVEIESVLMHLPTATNRNAVEDVLDQLSKSQIGWLEDKCFADVRESYEQAIIDRHAD